MKPQYRPVVVTVNIIIEIVIFLYVTIITIITVNLYYGKIYTVSIKPKSIYIV